MPAIVDPTGLPLPGPSPDPDDDIFSSMFDLGESDGAVELDWEQATECQCLTADTKQPAWNCPQCGGKGVRYLPARRITGLFRGRTQFQSYRREGELAHGEAQLTTPLSVKPGFVSRLVRDRITVRAAVADAVDDTVFYPATPPIPFVFNSIQRAWRVQLQSAKLSQDLE